MSNRPSKSKRKVPIVASKISQSNTIHSSSSTGRSQFLSTTAAFVVVLLAWYGHRYFAATTKGERVNEATLYKSLLRELQKDTHPQQQPTFAFVVPGAAESVDDEEQFQQAHIDDAINKALNDFNPDDKQAGQAAWIFLSRLASSTTFVQHYWHKRPLVIRAQDVAATTSFKRSTDNKQRTNEPHGSWVAGAFTVQQHLSMIDNSYITGFKTADGLRNGSDTTSWGYVPILSGEETGRSQWSDFQQALDGGTIYFNAAGSLWPNLGALCRLTQYAFGIPANVNVYATPANVSVSVPPHTDRQDVFVMQTEGSKHWRVYASIKVLANSSAKVVVDPTDRGKHGDVLTHEELGTPLLDVVLHAGDILYVPVGFPHTTDTAHRNSDAEDDNIVNSKTSVHLTMGLDTHVWSLTWAGLRSTLLQRSGKDSSWDVIKANPDNKENADALNWARLQTLPVGVFGGEPWRRSWNRILRRRSTRKHTSGIDLEFRRALIEETKRLLIRLEPNRWLDSSKQSASSKKNEQSKGYTNQELETLPTDREVGDAIDFFLSEHLLSVLMVQQEFFDNVDPHDESTGMRAFIALQKNTAIMERLAEFSKDEAMRSHYAQKRRATDAMMQGMV